MMTGSDHTISRWAPGSSYGPGLSAIDLYILQTRLELNPLLDIHDDKSTLKLNVATGLTSGKDGQAVYSLRDEPATIPRVNQLILISQLSPWCTIVEREGGVTVGDILSSIYTEYTSNDITDAELNSVSPRLQDAMKRQSATRSTNQTNGTRWGGYYTPQSSSRLVRVDWLRGNDWFEGLSRNEHYAKNVLGFNAANIFIMNFTENK